MAMAMYQPTYHYPSSLPPVAALRPESCQLSIRQQPKEALVTADGKEKARKPVDPPPILELTVPPQYDPHHQFLQSPYLFASVSLLKADKDEPYDGTGEKSLTGSLVSSLHRLKDTTNKDGGFFIFGDISVKVQGNFRLRFSLYEFQNGGNEVQCLGAVDSDVFKVLLPKDFKGMEESTYLSRAFSDQGVRLRLRKEPRGMMGSKRSYPYSAEPTDAPARPNMASEQSSSYDDTSSPNKRFKTEPDDRKDSFPESPRVSIPTYSSTYPTGQSYAAPTYADPPRQSNLPNPTNYNYNNVSIQSSYGNMAAGMSPSYAIRSNMMNAASVYSNPAFHPTTNSMLSGSLSHPSGYTNMHPTYNQRTAPATAVEYPGYSVDGFPTDSRYPPS